MKDIDFDELDKAVNSLMADVPKTPTPSSPTEKTVEIPTTGNSTTSTLPTPVTSPEPKTTPTLQTAPASRRGGRFMDVVHPSSDMKKPEATKPVSRQGVTIAPRSTASEPLPTVDKTIPTPISKEPSDSPVSEPPQDPVVKTDWPDPLDMAGFGAKDNTASPVEKEPPVPVPDQKDELDEPQTSTEELAAEPPLTSPFLPDTKVEKRPLGGNASEESSKNDLPVEVNDDQLPATADDVKPLLPEELHSDLVAIESDATEHKEDTEPQTDEHPVDSKPEKPAPWVEPMKEEKPKEAPTPTGPASIPQQYREEPSSGDQKNGAIYDTANYHQPLAHPAKQKSGWMWVVWIILILIIGAGGGAALYFLHIV
ncbi:MAG TPA: hypothetical protein VFH06_02580 [Candidatus Saccharimonadales bacterium]|nr:hypothetical protein [Candidatus Saccharimonadales bacterium]